jgi:hypothetical protein
MVEANSVTFQAWVWDKLNIYYNIVIGTEDELFFIEIFFG